VSDPGRLDRDGDVAVVTFDSPPLNLFDFVMGGDAPVPRRFRSSGL
jgi:hypothetical protein